MKRVLFYCQHLIGVGHLTRSIALCEALADSFEVDLIQGGPDIGMAPTGARVTLLPLSPLLMNDKSSALYDPIAGRDPADVLAERRRELTKALRGRRYDHLVVELYPFGRRKFRHEIDWLVARARRENPRLKVHCSLRDIMVEREPEREAETVAVLRRDYDTVLVHSDPRYIRLEETFARCPDIESMVRYTGFVSARPRAAAPTARSRRVLVSLGGGVVGAELAYAAAAVAPLFPTFEFNVALGPHTPGPVRARLARVSRRHKNVRLTGFLTDFQGELERSRMSVSLAGYNTVMDLLRTRTRGIVFPYDANREQALRAGRFERAGLLRTAARPDLKRERFASILRRELNKPYPSVSVDLAGAERTREILEEAR